MLTKSNIADKFWKEAVHTAVYIQNRCMMRPHENKTPYELWFGKKASARYFKVFGSKCYIKRMEENLGKFDDKADEDVKIDELRVTLKDNDENIPEYIKAGRGTTRKSTKEWL